MPPSRRTNTADPPTAARRRSGKAAPREPLSPERILQAALALVDEHGLDALSTRRLGQRLRCEAMSIYHHYPSKQHLLDAMVDRVAASIEIPPADGDPMRRVAEVFRAYRTMAHRFPAFFPYAAVHRLNTPTGVRLIESVLGVIRAAVPDDELAARYFRVAGYYLIGAALDETSGYAKGPSAAEPVDDAYIRAHCPLLMRAAPYFQRAQWDATFDLGLEILLAAMAADAKRLKSGARRR